MSVNDHRTQPTDEIFEVKRGPSDLSSTFIFGNEDHTLGNALRYVLMQRTETEFCGYSVPHPYEPKMNVRLQTAAGHPTVEVLKSGLKDLEEVANILDDAFMSAVANFEQKQ
jgi:DNA-directed RNA polymerases I and III subunit RPAC2